MAQGGLQGAYKYRSQYLKEKPLGGSRRGGEDEIKEGKKKGESSRLRWAGQVERMGERKSTFRVLMGKPEGRRPLGRRRRRWEDNIKMDFREVGWGSMDWIRLA